eukprot:5211915-Amphidinium_carterae.1
MQRQMKKRDLVATAKGETWGNAALEAVTIPPHRRHKATLGETQLDGMSSKEPVQSQHTSSGESSSSTMRVLFHACKGGTAATAAGPTNNGSTIERAQNGCVHKWSNSRL